jgi:hypothetical protein
LELLTTATIEILEKGVEARKLLKRQPDGSLANTSAWDSKDAFTLEINVSQITGYVTVGSSTIPLYGFPDNPLQLQRNAQLVLRALKPAHVLYEYRHLLKETFGPLFQDSYTEQVASYYYQDFRRYWLGAERIAGTEGVTRTDRALFSDVTRDFESIRTGAVLNILSGVNETKAKGFLVAEVRAFVQDDPVLRQYTTSPTGLSGTASVLGDIVTDTSQALWHTVVEGETLTFLTGPNAGAYRIKTLLGPGGGPAGDLLVTAPCTGARVAKTLLRLETRMGQSAVGQQYELQVDRLGMQVPHGVLQEDVTNQFFL